jgi:hypothetical protein
MFTFSCRQDLIEAPSDMGAYSRRLKNIHLFNRDKEKLLRHCIKCVWLVGVWRGGGGEWTQNRRAWCERGERPPHHKPQSSSQLFTSLGSQYTEEMERQD